MTYLCEQVKQFVSALLLFAFGARGPNAFVAGIDCACALGLGIGVLVRHLPLLFTACLHACQSLTSFNV